MLRAIPTPLLPSRGTNPADICEIPWMCPRSPLSPGCGSAARPGGPALLRGWGSAQPRRRQRGSPGLGGGFLVGARCLLASLHEGIPLPGASGSPHPPRPIGAAADVEPPQCPHVEGTRVGGGCGTLPTRGTAASHGSNCLCSLLSLSRQHECSSAGGIPKGSPSACPFLQSFLQSPALDSRDGPNVSDFPQARDPSKHCETHLLCQRSRSLFAGARAMRVVAMGNTARALGRSPAEQCCAGSLLRAPMPPSFWLSARLHISMCPHQQCLIEWSPLQRPYVCGSPPRSLLCLRTLG